MKINKRIVRKKIFISWVISLIAILCLALVGATLALLASRFLGPSVVFGLAMSAAALIVISFLFSPILCLWSMRAIPANPQEFETFYEVAKEVRGNRRMLLPSLYIMRVDVPNACAFGWGFWRGVAISPSLYRLLDRKELKAVVGHEFAHLRSRDVGIASVAALLSGGVEQAMQLFKSGKSVLGRGPFAWILFGIFWLASKIIIPVCRAALSQQREFSADALSALYCGSAEPMIAALRKLSSESHGRSDKGILSDLFISHPGMEDRILALQELC